MTAHGQTGARQRGLTLIELMIALAVGLLIVAALGYLFVGNRQAFRVQDSLARLQENGRYALEVLGQDLRQAGYIGCAEVGTGPGRVAVNVVANPALTANQDNLIGGTEGGAAGADELTLWRVDGRGATVSMTAKDAPLVIPPSPRQYAAGSPFLVADCQNADLFRASALVKTDATAIAHADTYNSSVYNSSAELSKAYGAAALVFPFEVIAYRIQTNPAGNPGLFRVVNGTAQEVVENVKDLQIVYGVDANGDGAVDAYRPADQVTDWTRVLAVRVSLLLRGPTPNIATAPPAVFWDRNNDGTNDFNPATDADAQARRLLQVFTTTIALRNRGR
jgi:type IV pilus assembly protein PilW